MREALALAAEEGLPAMWARHEAVHKQLWEGLAAMGLEPFVASPADRLPTVNTIKVGAPPVVQAHMHKRDCASVCASRTRTGTGPGTGSSASAGKLVWLLTGDWGLGWAVANQLPVVQLQRERRHAAPIPDAH